MAQGRTHAINEVNRRLGGEPGLAVSDVRREQGAPGGTQASGEHAAHDVAHDTPLRTQAAPRNRPLVWLAGSGAVAAAGAGAYYGLKPSAERIVNGPPGPTGPTGPGGGPADAGTNKNTDAKTKIAYTGLGALGGGIAGLFAGFGLSNGAGALEDTTANLLGLAAIGLVAYLVLRK